MPGSIRTIDAASQRYDSTDDSPPVVDRRKGNLVSQIQLPPSPADSDIVMREASPRGSPSATATEERRITRHLDRGAPGDQAIFSAAKTPEQKELAKRKSQYFGDVFAHREPNGSARERVTRESIVMADIRTNVIVHDEYTFITDLSSYLSARYQRPENSIVVSLTHSCCMLFGGNFDPAYTLTITALASQLQPVTNKRNATLLANHLEEGLGVGPQRGVIKFAVIAEENLATDGKTVSGEIEELEKEATENNVNLQRSLSRGTAKSRKRQSMKSLRVPKVGSNLATHNESMSPTLPLNQRETPPLPALPTEKSSMDRKAEKVQRMGRRKSFIATIFGKAG